MCVQKTHSSLGQFHTRFRIWVTMVTLIVEKLSMTVKCRTAIKEVLLSLNAIFSFDLFMVYIAECKQQLRTVK
jgi:hypothetical protein